MDSTNDTFLDNIKQEVISDESKISAVFSCNSQELTSSILFNVQKKDNVFKLSGIKKTRHKFQSFRIQSIFASKSKGLQTNGNSKSVSSSCQTYHNDIKTPGNNLLYQLTQCNNFEKLNALCGHGHFSQVTSEKCFKGKYPPIKGEFKFPILCITTFLKNLI